MAIGSLASTVDVSPAALMRRDAALPRAGEIPAERGQSVDPRQAVDGRPQIAQKGAEGQRLVERRSRRGRGQDAGGEQDAESRDPPPSAGEERALLDLPQGAAALQAQVAAAADPGAAGPPDRRGFPGKSEPGAAPWQAARAYARGSGASLPAALFLDLEV